MSKKTPASDVAFTRSVKAEQERRGSRGAYARMESGEGWSTTITDDLREFIAQRDSFYLATATADGQPYIQHRGGPRGFVEVLDDATLAFADYAGNKQFVTVGNLAENDRAFLFFMDYARRQRIKVWGRARVVEGDAELLARVMPKGYKARGERVILFTVLAWDVNCPQHIPQKVDAADAREATSRLESRIRDLETENAGLRAQLAREPLTRAEEGYRSKR